jgi:hypothetical protein
MSADERTFEKQVRPKNIMQLSVKTMTGSFEEFQNIYLYQISTMHF